MAALLSVGALRGFFVAPDEDDGMASPGPGVRLARLVPAGPPDQGADPLTEMNKEQLLSFDGDDDFILPC